MKLLAFLLLSLVQVLTSACSAGGEISLGGGRLDGAGQSVRPLVMPESERGVQLLEAKPEKGTWLIRGCWIGPDSHPVYWRVDFKLGVLQVLPHAQDWDANASLPVTIVGTDSFLGDSFLRRSEGRFWVEDRKTKRVTAQADATMRHLWNAGADPSRRWVIALGTNSPRREHSGRFGVPLPSQTTYTFGDPKTLALQAHSFPDLKPVGSLVLLLDAHQALPDFPTARGFAEYLATATAKGMPGVLVIAENQTIWAVGEHLFQQEKP